MKTLLLIGAVFLLSRLSFALTPPWSPETLVKESDLVVEGEVGQPVICLGRIDQNKCFDTLKFSVPLKVNRVIKGAVKKGETVKTTFFYYDYGKSDCVGDQAAVLHSGDQGTFYLKKLEDGTFSPVHWSGAQVKVHGAGSLPKCPSSAAPSSVKSIGQAAMAQDGTITLDLRAEDSKGSVGDARLVYPPSHPRYPEILKHVGEIKPGETKPVAPF